MKIDLYTPCWNDADKLGFMFRHYDSLVQRYIVYDDGSTDQSLEILHANPKVEVRPAAFNSDPRSRLNSVLPLTETCWKESRTVADWVIICEIDEHLFHPNLETYLRACKNEGITIIPALGYQMISESFPAAGEYLCQSLTMGAPWGQMNKLGFFSPDDVETLNFTPGRHQAQPTGNIVAPDRDELLLLHYKYLDFERTHRRHEQCAPRMRITELTKGWGHRWLWSREQLREDWKKFERDLVDVSRPDLAPWQSHPAPRWWEKYRKSAPRDAAAK